MAKLSGEFLLRALILGMESKCREHYDQCDGSNCDSCPIFESDDKIEE